MTRPAGAPEVKMTNRSIRFTDEQWERLTESALERDLSVSEVLRELADAMTSSECADCGHDHGTEVIAIDDPVGDGETVVVVDLETDGDDAPEGEAGKIATIVGHGLLSESEDPETQAAVIRVRELLAEGAVGVSVSLDLNPDEMPSPETIARLQEEEKWDELAELMDKVHYRIRHLAIVDTAAFADAHLVLNDDGSVSGPMVFEGPWTGDERLIPFEKIDLDASPFPIPILWDREEGDHSGMTVGAINTAERLEGDMRAVAAAAHMLTPDVTAEDVQAVTAAAGPTGVFPARFFEPFKSKGPVPLHVDAPDPETGLRRVWGTLAPKGVCHRSDMGACFKFPGDVDKEHGGFHTGAVITLDNGKTMRMGALTSGGLHVDTRLAQKGVGWREANRHREDSSKVFAMGRAWADAQGHLQFSGVLAAKVTPEELLQNLACGPSVELWPKGRGLTLTGAHMVPTQAWPVVASAGPSVVMASGVPVEVEDAEEIVRELEAEEAIVDLTNLSGIMESQARIEKALALLVSDKIAEIPDEDPAD